MLALLVVTVLAQAPALPLEAPRRVSKLKWSPPVDLPVTAALGAGWLVSEFAVKKQLAPATCRWCETNNLDDSFRTLFAPRVGLTGGSVPDDASNVLWVSSAIVTLGISRCWR